MQEVVWFGGGGESGGVGWGLVFGRFQFRDSGLSQVTSHNNATRRFEGLGESCKGI